MKLNRTGSNWNRLERNKINENWDIIEGSYNDVVGQITDEVVGHLIDSAKLIWKEPVDTVDDLPTNAEVGETRMVREADPDGISYVYRYDGEKWEKIQAIDVTLVNEVDRRLTRQLADNVQRLKDENSNAKVPLSIPVYHEEDNHTVHPSVMYFTDKKYGYNWIMAHTPYSEGRDRFENPSIAVSDDGYFWYVPEGLKNPLVNIPVPQNTHYSDVDLFDNGTQLELWYRYTDKNLGKSQIWRRKSTDCINWTDAELIFDFGEYGENGYLSPTVIYENAKYRLWYRSSAGVIHYRESIDLQSWTDIQVINFDFGSHGNHAVWHLEVRKFEDKYMCMMNAFQNGEYKLFYFKSTDGINFTLKRLLLRPTYNNWDNGMIYRSSLVRYGGWYYVYYSAQSKDLSWHIGLSKGRAAYDLDELVGTNLGDYFSKNGGVSNGGEGSQKYYRKGIGSAIVQPTRPDTLAIFNEGKKRKGFYESDGLYLGTENNLIHRQENGLYINPVSQRITYHKNSASQYYARFINFKITANGGNGTINIYNGNDFLEDVVSVPAGLQINFKNMTGVVPHIKVMNASDAGLVTSDGINVNFFYCSTKDSSMAVIGIKEKSSGGHTAFNNIASGAIEVCVVF